MICCGNKIVCCGNKISFLWEQNNKLWEQDIILREQNKKNSRMALISHCRWRPCEREKNIVSLVPTRKIFCSHNILSCSLNYIILFPQNIILLPQYIMLFPQHIISFPQYIILASVVRFSVRPTLTFHSKTFFSETTGPIRTKLWSPVLGWPHLKIVSSRSASHPWCPPAENIV